MQTGNLFRFKITICLLCSILMQFMKSLFSFKLIGKIKIHTFIYFFFQNNSKVSESHFYRSKYSSSKAIPFMKYLLSIHDLLLPIFLLLLLQLISMFTILSSSLTKCFFKFSFANFSIKYF